MAELVKTFDFDIQPSTTHVSGEILPNREAAVTFQVQNLGSSRKRPEAILEPLEGPYQVDGLRVPSQNWAGWLQLLELKEYDYQPQSMNTYTAKIMVGDLVTEGTYSFRLLLCNPDDPDHECAASDTVSFKVAHSPRSAGWLVFGLITLVALVLIGSIIRGQEKALSSTITPISTITPDGRIVDFGDALAFNGSNVIYLDSLVHSELAENTTTDPPTATSVTPGTGTGLKRTSYSGKTFLTGTPTHSPIGETVNINYDDKTEHKEFSVRWEGFIQPLYSEHYDFKILSDDGVKLWVNNELIINNWSDHSIEQNYHGYELKANELYPIRIEYYQNQGGATIQLLWSSSSQKEEIIPLSQLYPAEYTAPIPNKTEMVLKATQTSIAATQTSLAKTQTVTSTQQPSEPEGVPVTIAAWVRVGASQARQQTILTLGDGNASISLSIVNDAKDGRVQAIYRDQKAKTKWIVEDTGGISLNQWVHYAMIFWFDKNTGALTQDAQNKPRLLLFSDAIKVEATPTLQEGSSSGDISNGLYLGGGGTTCASDCFTGQIDEVRIWNRALYKPIDNKSNTSPEINLWRRLPGFAFDEIAYWSFDNHTGETAEALCAGKFCDKFNFTIPALIKWIPNNLSNDNIK